MRNNTKYSYLLRCLLTCQSCGLAIFGTTYKATDRQPERRYYQCHGKDPILSARDHKCLQRPAKAGELEEAIWEHVKGLMADPERLRAQFESFACSASESGEEDAEAKKFEGHLKRLSREDTRLVDAYQTGIIELEELQERRAKIEERRKALRTRHKQQVQLRRQATQAREVLENLEAFRQQVNSRLDDATFEEKQAILQLLIERVVVGEDNLEIHHVIPLGSDPPRSPWSHAAPPEFELRSDGVHPTPLPARSLQNSLYGSFETLMGVAGYKPYSRKTASHQRAQEREPEGSVLAAAYVQSQNLPLAALCVHTDGDHHRQGEHLPVLARLDVGGVQTHIRVGACEFSVAEALHL